LRGIKCHRRVLWFTGRVKRTLPRSCAALFAILGLLFAQLSVAAFACPGPEAMVAVPAMEMPGCDMAPAERDQSPLCQAHCVQGDSSIQKPLAAVAGMAAICEHPASPLVERIVLLDRGNAGRQHSLLERPTGPPLAVLHCRFLI
jgi:hypothetical protein